MEDARPVRVRTRQLGSKSATVQHKVGGEITSESAHTEKIAVPEDLRNPAYVMVKGGVTRNMLNYESVTVAVSLSLPCRAVDEEIDQTFSHAMEMVEGYVATLLNNATGGETIPPEV